MSPEQRMVKEFHEKYGAPSRSVPTMITAKDSLRRARLIVGEAAEFLEHADKGDFVEMVDALADILVVTYGTAVEMGVDLEPVFAEVHRSNMSKNGGMDAGGKILKGPGFSPPDLLAELLKQGFQPAGPQMGVGFAQRPVPQPQVGATPGAGTRAVGTR